MTLARRRVLKFAMASTALATLSACGAGGMGGMATGMMGGGGGKSWSEIVSSFENLMNQAVAGVAETQESIAMLAEALGLKQEAAVLRGEAKNIIFLGAKSIKVVTLSTFCVEPPREPESF